MLAVCGFGTGTKYIRYVFIEFFRFGEKFPLKMQFSFVPFLDRSCVTRKSHVSTYFACIQNTSILLTYFDYWSNKIFHLHSSIVNSYSVNSLQINTIRFHVDCQWGYRTMSKLQQSGIKIKWIFNHNRCACNPFSIWKK